MSNDSQTTIYSNGWPTIVRRWKAGRRLLDKCANAHYGSRARQDLAERCVDGFGSAGDVYQHIKLAKCWTLTMAVQADKRQMPWNAVVALLPYEPSSAEQAVLNHVGGAGDRAHVARCVAERRKQLKGFIKNYMPGTKGISHEILKWRRDHFELWPSGEQSRMVARQRVALAHCREEVEDRARSLEAATGGVPDADSLTP